MSSDSVVTPTLVTASADRVVGRVKWFNNKSGYGFITVSDGAHAGSDIFVHHSGVRVSSEQYKYLVQGEYVEFSVEKTAGGAHEYQAGDVSGIAQGKLMCETRRDFRQTREELEPRPPRNKARLQLDDEKASVPREKPQSRGSGPREGSEWTLVKKGSQGEKKRGPRSKAPPAEV